MKKLGRLITAMVTPFNEDGEVDYGQAKKLALALLDSGSDGLAVVGTTGESPTVTWEEELQLFGEVKSVVGERGAIIAGTLPIVDQVLNNAARLVGLIAVDEYRKFCPSRMG